MALRAYWKGFMRVGLVSCPIKLYTATTDANRISFNQLHKDTHNRIQQKLFDPELGEIPRSDIVKGYEIEKGKYVVVSQEELDNIKLETNKTIEIDRFVKAGAIEPIFLDKPYYLVPDGPVAQDIYRVLQEGMKKKGVTAIGRVVMSGRERTVSVGVKDVGMMLTTLRHPGEIRKPEAAFEGMTKQKSPPDQLELFEQLIEQRSEPFQPELFEDRYEAAVLDLIKAKMVGKELVTATEPQMGEVIDLMEALRASVKAAPAKKPPAKGKRKPASKRKTG